MQQSRVLADEKDNDDDINLTPMLDVVFILLIFFIVTASFSKEFGIGVNAPEAAIPDVPEHANILIVISEKNDVWIERRLVDPRAVRANIERLQTEIPNGKVVIHADKQSSNKTLILVMDAARQAGIYDIAMAGEGS